MNSVTSHATSRDRNTSPLRSVTVSLMNSGSLQSTERRLPPPRRSSRSGQSVVMTVPRLARPPCTATKANKRCRTGRELDRLAAYEARKPVEELDPERGQGLVAGDHARVGRSRWRFPVLVRAPHLDLRLAPAGNISQVGTPWQGKLSPVQSSHHIPREASRFVAHRRGDPRCGDPRRVSRRPYGLPTRRRGPASLRLRSRRSTSHRGRGCVSRP